MKSHYRLEVMNEAAMPARSVDLFCEDDEQAIWLAKRHRRHGAILLFQGERVVRHLPRMSVVEGALSPRCGTYG